MRYRFVGTHKKIWPINLMCQVLDVSRSGYYDWQRRPESARARLNRELDSEIRQVFGEHRQRYGVPRITDELKGSWD